MKKWKMSPILPLMALLTLLWSCSPYHGGGYMGSGGGMMGYGGYGGMVMWLIFIIVIAVVVYLVYNRNIGAGGSLRGRHESPLDILKTRLFERGTDDEETIRNRLKEAQTEIESMSSWYRYVIVNRNLNEAVSQLKSIIVAERCRHDRTFIKEFFNAGKTSQKQDNHRA